MIFSDRYRLDDNLWLPDEKYSFQYSDGDDTENYILNAVQQSADVSVGSSDLYAWVKDWPSLYHLSPKRADLLRPFSAQLQQKKILEIGSGCGAITRFLGELDCELLALEGSTRRAKITRERCRDLANVQVLADNFDEFVTEEKFDCITLVGVLEYANLFIKGDNPPLAMLQRVKQLLQPGGVIIIAIENQLGLKYLAGAPEDHLGVAFAGVENRYNHNTAITFGKTELNELLREAGLDQSNFFYPFPDYKLPVSIITENGLQRTGFDVPGLLLEKHEYIQGHSYNSFFNISLAEHAIHSNGLTADLANSFLVVAGPGSVTFKDSTLLATSYSTSRKKPYCKSVAFRSHPGKKVVISKERIYNNYDVSPSIRLVLEPGSYRPGLLLQEQLLRIISINNWNLDQLRGWAMLYYNILVKNSSNKDDGYFLEGSYLDLTPFNIIIGEDDEPFIFDQEWDAGELLPLEYVFFRGLYYSFGQVVFFNLPESQIPRCLLELSSLLLQQVAGQGNDLVGKFRERETQYFSAVWLQDYKPFMPEPMRIRSFELQQEEIQKITSELTELRKADEEPDALIRTIKQLKLQLENQLKENPGTTLRTELESLLKDVFSSEWYGKLQYRQRLQETELQNHRLELTTLRDQLEKKEIQFRELVKNRDDLAAQQKLLENYQQQLTTLKEELDKKEAQLREVEKSKDDLSAKETILLRELSEKDRVLQDLQFNYNLSRQQLGEVNNTLVTIYHSDGWKWLNRYYKFKGKFLNENSRHYKIMRKVVNFLRNRNTSSSLLANTTPGNKQFTGNTAEALIADLEPVTRTLPRYENPEVSIIIPVYNAWAMNVKCVTSILENTNDISYEVIIADDCSTDRTKDIASYFENIVHIRNEKNLGFILNCNNAATSARGKFIHFLNNDTEVKPGWLSSLVRLMKTDEKVGMAGSKLVYPDGRLQEAGGIIWNDASGWNFGNGQNPELPEFNYVKEADYISGASIMVRADLWKELDGFDTAYSPAYCEDSDFAFRLREKGYKVMYQPLSVVIHYEGFSHGTDSAKSEISSVKEYQRINNVKFYQKWKSVLQREQFANGENVFWARDRSRNKKTLLMVDHYVPQFDKDAGSRTTFQYLELFVKMGFNVKFLGENFYRHEPYTTVLQQMGIEVLYGPWYAENWKQWFNGNREKFDYVYLNRPHISINFIDFFKQQSRAKIIYYGHDLHFLRKQKKYELEKDKKILEQAAKWKEIEMYLFSKSDVILTPSLDEQKVIQSLGSDFNVQLMRPYIYKTINDPVESFQQRENIFFVGGFGHSPNVDGILWFVRESWLTIKNRIPGIKFIIAGSNPPKEITELSNDPDIIIKGYISEAELEQLYSSCRLAVIPLRYGAGVKGKTVEAMRFGIPLVTTSFGVEGLPGDFSFLKVSDNASGLAENIISLYEDEYSLCEQSRKSVAYIKNNFTEKVAEDVILKAFAAL